VIKHVDLAALLINFIGDEMLIVGPGPEDPEAPGRWVKISREPGLGLDAENLFDQVSFSVEVAGEQEDYASAEDLAFDVDRFFLRLGRQKIGGVLAQGWSRNGGPQSLLIDNSRRWHFICSYTVYVQSALTV
jgi:hypothetical protein